MIHVICMMCGAEIFCPQLPHWCDPKKVDALNNAKKELHTELIEASKDKKEPADGEDD